jgi:hypothetical protein
VILANVVVITNWIGLLIVNDWKHRKIDIKLGNTDNRLFTRVLLPSNKSNHIYNIEYLFYVGILLVCFSLSLSFIFEYTHYGLLSALSGFSIFILGVIFSVFYAYAKNVFFISNFLRGTCMFFLVLTIGMIFNLLSPRIYFIAIVFSLLDSIGNLAGDIRDYDKDLDINPTTATYLGKKQSAILVLICHISVSLFYIFGLEKLDYPVWNNIYFFFLVIVCNLILLIYLFRPFLHKIYIQVKIVYAFSFTMLFGDFSYFYLLLIPTFIIFSIMSYQLVHNNI